MTSTTSPKILLTGATGYIGGSVLANLLASPSFSTSTITLLVRGQDRVTTLSSTYGPRVNPVLYEDIDDIEATIAVASQHDIVINTTLGTHTASTQAIIQGLAERKKSTGRDVWLIHTSGTSNLSDQPISGKYVDTDPEREFDDAKDDVYGYEKEREALHPYFQRSTELSVVDLGLELGVKTLVIMSPTIFGIGTGLYNKKSIQIPVYIRSVLKHGHGVVVEEGKGVWDHVHMEDLAELYKIVMIEILEQGGKRLPTGKEGIIFSGNGRHTWMEVAQGVTDALYEEGKITDKRVESIGLAEGAHVLEIVKGLVDETLVELALSSNSRTVSTVARRLGWKPTRGEDAWRKGFQEDVKAVLLEK